LNRAAVLRIIESPIKQLINTPDWPYFWPREVMFVATEEVFISHPQDLSMSIIGERVNKEAKLRNMMPNILRVRRGFKFHRNMGHFIYREISLKSIRALLQIWKRTHP
jgi:hypothetical protein